MSVLEIIRGRLRDAPEDVLGELALETVGDLRRLAVEELLGRAKGARMRAKLLEQSARKVSPDVIFFDEVSDARWAARWKRAARKWHDYARELEVSE